MHTRGAREDTLAQHIPSSLSYSPQQLPGQLVKKVTSQKPVLRRTPWYQLIQPGTNPSTLVPTHPTSTFSYCLRQLLKKLVHTGGARDDTVAQHSTFAAAFPTICNSCLMSLCKHKGISHKRCRMRHTAQHSTFPAPFPTHCDSCLDSLCQKAKEMEAMECSG